MPEKSAQKHQVEDQQSKKSGAGNLLFVVAVAAFSVFFAFFVLRPAQVEGPSMQDTLNQGDFVLVWQLGYQPMVGDLVVTSKNNPAGVPMVKRVVAVAGQQVTIQHGKLLRDGVQVEEPYLKQQDWDSPNLEILVPDGEVFLMGDNRSQSRDSREFGCFKVSELLGKVIWKF